MLDLKFVLDHLDEVKRNLENRKVEVDLDKLKELANLRVELIKEVESLRHRQNEIAKKMKTKMPPQERKVLIEEGKELKGKIQKKERELGKVEEELLALQLKLPNMTHPDAPVGDGEEDNIEVRRWGEPTKFSFKPKDHVQLMEELDLIDWEAGARVTGSKFYFLKNDAVFLELALIKYALDILKEEGFTVNITPDLARQEIISFIGFNPRGEETQIYSIENSDLALIATAEITLGGMFEGQILDEKKLPILLGGLSHCFRTEAGAPGRASRGLYRVHQFTKVEMFAFTLPEDSDSMLDRFVAIQEKIFQGLGIPYRVVDCCTADLGAQAYRKFDIEAWMPGRGENGSYGEVTSASNCTDYQARRLKTRFRRPDHRRPILVHTLNGTAIATSRAMVAIIENYQQEDGSIVIPEVLRPFMGKDKIEPKNK